MPRMPCDRLAIQARAGLAAAQARAGLAAAQARAGLVALACVLAAWHAPAAAFQADLSDPALHIEVPGLPALALSLALARTEPAGPAAAARLVGDDGTYAVEVLATPSAQAANTRTCAGQFIRSLVQRPGMPARDNIYRAPLNAQTFLVLYILRDNGQQVLHAHLLAAAPGTHCVEAHFNRRLRAGEDEDDWRRQFDGARIDPFRP